MKLPRIHRPSLRVTLVLYVVAPLVTALSLTGYVALRVWEQEVEARMKRDLEVVARAIQLPLSHAMERERPGGINQALESAFAIGSVYSASAYDLEGEEIASAGYRDPEPEKGKFTDLALEGSRQGEYGRMGKRRVYSYFVPLKDSRDQTSGLLRLTRRERDFQRYLRQVRFHAVLWLGLAAVLMCVLVLFGQHMALGRYFRRFTDGMQRISKGDSEYRLLQSGPKEIASLAGSFNQMVDSIQRAEQEIRRNQREQQALEQRLRQSEKLAAIGQLAAGVAHELGTPLATVSGIAQRFQRKLDGNANAGKAFANIRAEVNRMEVIIRQLLDFSHSQQLHRRRLNPLAIAKSALAAVTDEAARRSVTLRNRGGPPDAVFRADPVRVEQALVNLLLNAIQAGDHIEVTLESRTEDDFVVFTVSDSGPGISEEIQPRMFEPFFTTKRVGEGTGLGLAVVHGVAEEHSGRVVVGRSDLGGARFDLYFPVGGDRANGKDEGA